MFIFFLKLQKHPSSRHSNSLIVIDVTECHLWRRKEASAWTNIHLVSVSVVPDCDNAVTYRSNNAVTFERLGCLIMTALWHLNEIFPTRPSCNAIDGVDGKPSSCQVIYSQFGLAIHQNDHQARRRFVEWAQNEIAVVPDFHKRILFSDEAHFWLNGYVNKQNCRIWSEANPQVYVETPLHPEKLTVWCALWAGGIFLQKR
ncbi:hypothetical protein TNCV_1093481 [Trichonephila clavipes]|nr:hypothetical protein TNCV_1093481 [Trichonephila clavipes]